MDPRMRMSSVLVSNFTRVDERVGSGVPAFTEVLFDGEFDEGVDLFAHGGSMEEDG